MATLEYASEARRATGDGIARRVTTGNLASPDGSEGSLQSGDPVLRR
jgi:hypothetical protein